MIKEFIVKTALKEAYDAVKKLLNKSEFRIITPEKGLSESISFHIQFVDTWSSEISFSDLRQNKKIHNIYVPLDIFLYPSRIRIERSERPNTIEIDNLFNSENTHFIISGQPGAGKTTSMKYLCHRIIHDESFYPDLFNFPIVIRFRDLNSDKLESEIDALGSFQSLIFKKLYNILGLNIGFGEEQQKNTKVNTTEEKKDILRRIITTYLNKFKVLLILDGFDELSLPELKQIAIEEIQSLSYHLNTSSMIVTSRTGEFVYNISDTSDFELCPLSKQQIAIFSQKWLKNPKDIKKFNSEIAKSPFADTTIKPLTLAHLCAIYERIGKIPEKPKTVYKKIVTLLIEDWDEQRLVRRSSKYSNFESDRKFEFLCHMAFVLSTELKRSTFSINDLENAYKKICSNFDLPTKEAKKVAKELETHTGLLIQSGFRSYDFTHKSIQEYLTAEYIVKLPTIPSDVELISKVPHEIAIAVSISSNPSLYLTEITLKRIVDKILSRNFFISFISRLLQEKPDFNSHSDVILSLAALYSQYVRAMSKIDDQQLSLFYDDELFHEIEALIALLTKRNKRSILDSFYKINGEASTLNGHKLFNLKKIMDSQNYNLPNNLLMRETFFKN